MSTPLNPDSSLRVPSSTLTKTLGAEMDLITLTGVATPAYPPDLTGGATYTVVILRSTQPYDFRFIFNPEGIFQKVNTAYLTILSTDCNGCPLRIDFSYSVNGVNASASIQLPGQSFQGPATNIVPLAPNATSAVRPGSNGFSVQMKLETSSTGTTTNFPFGVYKVALIADYLTTD